MKSNCLRCNNKSKNSIELHALNTPIGVCVCARKFVLRIVLFLFSAQPNTAINFCCCLFKTNYKNATCWNFRHIATPCAALSFSLARSACSPLIWYRYIHQMLFVVKLAISMPSMGCETTTTTTTKSHGKTTLSARMQLCTDG